MQSEKRERKENELKWTASDKWDTNMCIYICTMQITRQRGEEETRKKIQINITIKQLKPKTRRKSWEQQEKKDLSHTKEPNKINS